MRKTPLLSLAEISESVRYGYTASASDNEVGPKFLRITDIVPPQIDWENVPYCDIDEKDLSKFSIEPGDIVIARTGATVGYAKLIRDNVPKSVFASYLVRIRVDPEKADPWYVGRIVESGVYKSFVLSRVGGAAQPNANAKILSSFKLPIPDKTTQRLISSILSAYDDLIENNQQRIRLLEQSARLLYKEWFVRLRFPGHEHVKVKDGVPEGWCFKCIGEITTKIGSGSTPRGGAASYKSEGITLIRSLNVYDYQFEESGLAFIDEKQAEKLSNVVVEPDDILLNITGASVGRCCMVPDRLLPARVNQHVMIIRAHKGEVGPYYLLCAINDNQQKQMILNIARSGGATREALTKDVVSGLRIPIPAKGLMDAFNENACDSFKQQQILANQNAQLAKARDLLLPRLMNGEIVV
jgi:type I restriction enzyme, S subunit